MKKIWKSVLRAIKSRKYQQKAIKYAEDVEKTKTIHRAPRHPTEQKHFQKVQADEKITQILRAQCDKDFVLKLNEERRDILLPQILESLEKHPAMQRIDTEAFNTIWQYFRPFERKEQQYIVKRKDIDELRDLMLGFHKEPELPSFESLKRKREQKLEAELHVSLEGHLNEHEKERLERLEKMKELKGQEDLRLSQELKKLGLMNEDKEPDEADKDHTEKRRLEQAK
ncbi:unnamed protein product [Acanthocheilonema viteae]|uniref:Uncharacterized protein n=1 Tax=Acanthocheilonema viteae TaxID=6277 RepID=A0A498SA25_ACAVI|nr:unnamed protein product [Acanthocheilonema viteae]